jgi:hypothetical protein
MYQRTMTGPVRPEVANMPDLKARELWAVGPLVALIVVLGVYPKPILDIINPAVHSTLVGVHSTDPVPPHPATAPARPASTTSKVSTTSTGGTTSLVHHQHRQGRQTLRKQGSSA